MGNKLSVISKYRLESATRYQLPLAPADPLTRQFTHKRALFEVRIPIADYSDLVILATHLEVSSKGAKVKQQEVSAIQKHLQKHTEAEALWILGGDFNLLPPGQRERLPEVHQAEFRPDTELQPLLDRYQSVPSREDLRNSLGTSSFTMFHNAPLITAPDRTLDYIFYTDQLTLERGYVRHHDTLAISDHLPVVAEFTLPKD